MLTQCPHCATIFPLQSDHYLLANGRVRCGVCEQEFDALDHLRRAADPTDIPRLDPEFSRRQGDLFAPPELPPEPLPGFLTSRSRLPGARFGWWLASAALALGLGLQIVLVERDQLALDPRWRPAYQTLCDWLHCALPIWRAPAQWQLLARDVGPHPSADGALLVTATLRNDAPWPQPAPLLELSMADIDGRPLALRRFLPGEYSDSRDGAPIAAGQTLAARLEIVDPGKEALAFAFEFR